MASDSLPKIQAAPAVQVPPVPVLALKGAQAVRVTPDGEIEDLTRTQARHAFESEPVMVAHGGFVAQRLGRPRPARRPGLFDVMELFAFVFPARFCLPTPPGLARVLGLDPPDSAEDDAVTVAAAAHALLETLARPDYPDKEDAGALASTMAQAGWPWGMPVLNALGFGEAPPAPGGGLDVWTRLPEWEERSPQGGVTSHAVDVGQATARLRDLLGPDQEPRPGQDTYVQTAARAFTPREKQDEPAMVLAEAGTGIGKTLGYVAPASLWAEANGPGTWISTYTKNLQRQIDQELDRLYPDPHDKRRFAVVRKGRENYVCLLNFEDATRRARSGLGEDAVAIALVARWLKASRDGDMVGGDFPSWLVPPSLIHGTHAPGLTDRRGECIYSACPHYRKCTIEKAVRKARHARLVVANHALVMYQSALDQALATVRGEEETKGAERRLRVIFDEGHHLFGAADDAFGATLSALETSDLRRWIRGAESRRGSRTRGLNERIGDLAKDDRQTDEALQAVLEAARALPRDGWAARASGEGQPSGAAERFFAALRAHVEARADRPAGPSLAQESDTAEPGEVLLSAADAFESALGAIAAPLTQLSQGLRARLDEEAASLEPQTRTRIEAVSRGLDRRALLTIPAWQHMLRTLRTGTPETYVDWFQLERAGGRVVNAAMERRHIDPMKPFADRVVRPLHGVLITSATLRDEVPSGDGATEKEPKTDESWEAANARTGARHLPAPSVHRASIPSPFDYGRQTRIIVVRDVAQNAADQVAAAYRELFLAAGGGALGLFTAIHRLRIVHERLIEPLQERGLPLYAQHVDAMDTGTLVDIFRAETDACLLGTDAVRDGVDVPGDALRLIVFDRVPWPRPDLLHKARRAHFGARAYDDALTRLRLKQAYGRLVRGPGDRGVFVMLDSRLPTRLCSAFPPGVTIERIGLAEAVAKTGDFLSKGGATAGPLAGPAPIA